jgi:hypothetical protein
MLFYVFIFIGTLWGILTLISFQFKDAKCSSCKMYGERDYMVEVSPKNYKHYSCRFDPPYSFPVPKVKFKSTHFHGSE